MILNRNVGPAVVALIVAVMMPVAANADWVHTKSEDAFNGDQHIAADLDFSGYMIGFRCNAGDIPDLTLVYATPEHLDQDTYQSISSISMDLAVIIDSAPKVSIKANIDTYGDNDRARLLSTDPAITGLMKATMAAHRRFAIAIVGPDGKAFELAHI